MKKEDDIKCECGGELIPYIDDDNSCSCHINPPCSKCTDERMVCEECGKIDYPKYEPIKSNYKPPVLKSDINSGIDYITKRSGGWHVVNGTNRKGMTLSEIKNKLGNFDKYHMFMFKNSSDTTFSASWTTN
jgi:hypothetical protein